MSVNRPLIAALGALSCLTLAATAPADARPRKPAAKPPAAAPAPAPAVMPTLTPEQQRAEANAAQAKAAADQNAQNAANQQAYQDALKAREEKIARDKAEYDAAMKKWEADTAACKAGDVSKCAKAN
jgi:hypothetical protein